MSTRVYVGGISHRARERDVEKLFDKFGRIKDVSLKNGFAFVEFDDDRDADDAVYDLNRSTFMGERISVEIARGTPHGRDRDRFGSSRSGRDRSPRGGRDRRPSWMDKYGAPERTDYKLIVENLSSRVSWQDLKDYMRQAGEVCYADAHKNHKGEGVVEFATHEDLQTALDKLDGTELNGRKITLTESKRRRKRSRSASRTPPRRSRTKSRSRSRERGSGGGSSGRRKSRSRSRSRSRDGSRERNSAGGRSRSGSHGGRDHEGNRGRMDGEGDDEGGRGRRGSESN